LKIIKNSQLVINIEQNSYAAIEDVY